MKKSTRKSPRARKDTHLIVLAAVAAFVALLLFLDAFVPVIPDGKERPDREEEKIEADKEEETKKHWWQGIFDRKDPVETDEPDAELEFPWLEDGTAVERPHPTVTLTYSEEEMSEWYFDALARTLIDLEYLEYSGSILPISQVGLFNVDTHGSPELIVVHETEGGSREYEVYELQSLEMLLRWSCYGSDDELAMYEWANGGYTALFTHSGDGDDRYICELESTDRLRYMERTARILDKDTVTYRYEGRRTSEKAYDVAVKSMESTYKVLDETRLLLTTWHSDMDKERLAKIILSSGQVFLHTDATEP